MRARVLVGGLSAIFALAACASDVGSSGGSEGSVAPVAQAPASADGALATFDGSFDAASGALSIAMREPGKTGSGVAAAALPPVTIPSGTGTDQMTMHTVSTSWNGGTSQLTGSVTAISHYTSSAVSAVTAVIDSVSVSGITNTGPYSYGTVTAGATSAPVTWTFNVPGGTNFTFIGHIQGARVSAVPTSGLVAYYRGAGKDLSGFGLDMTVHNVSLVADRFGTPGLAGSFAGNTSSYLEHTNQTQLPMGASPRTVSVWMKASTGAGGIFNWGNTQKGHGQRFGMLDISNKTYFVGEVDDQAGNVTIVNNAWHHIVVTFDGTGEVTYVDNSVDTSRASFSPALNTIDRFLEIGASSHDHPSPEAYAGLIDQLRIYSRVLSTAEIGQLFAEGT